MENYLKFAFLLIAFIYVVQSNPISRDEAESVFRELAMDCVEKTGSTADDLEKLIKHEPFQNREGKCLAECVMKQFDTISPNGKLNKAKMMGFAKLMLKDDEEKLKIAEEIIDSCLHITHEDHCELAADFGQCLHKNVVEKSVNVDW